MAGDLAVNLVCACAHACVCVSVCVSVCLYLSVCVCMVRKPHMYEACVCERAQRLYAYFHVCVR